MRDRVGGVGRLLRVGVAAVGRNAKMRARRTRSDAQRLSFRQILSVRATTSVQHQAAADGSGRLAQAEPDILAAQHLHRSSDHLFLEQQSHGRNVEEFSQLAVGPGTMRISHACYLFSLSAVHRDCLSAVLSNKPNEENKNKKQFCSC